MANRQRVTPLNPVISQEQGAIIAKANSVPLIQDTLTPPSNQYSSRMAELEAQLALAKAENQTLKAQAKKPQTAGTLTLRVSQKGALAVYGLGRFPVTLYVEQWERLLAIAGEIKDFIVDNSDGLKRKTRDED